MALQFVLQPPIGPVANQKKKKNDKEDEKFDDVDDLDLCRNNKEEIGWTYATSGSTKIPPCFESVTIRNNSLKFCTLIWILFLFRVVVFIVLLNNQ